MNQKKQCEICGREIFDDSYTVGGLHLCEKCYDSETFCCDCCGNRFLNTHDHGDDSTALCLHCYEEHYHRCARCNMLVYADDVYWENDETFCRDCYEEYHNSYIKDYYYKPSPIFYKRHGEETVRYYGIELEIDRGVKDDDYAERIYDKANRNDDVLYIKSDSSLDEGMELVSHPCSMQYHKHAFPWKEIMKEAVQLGYRSHNTTTCGLHIHIGRAELGETVEQQEEVISRIMFFFESHWNEIFNSPAAPNTPSTVGPPVMATRTSQRKFWKTLRKLPKAATPV